MLISIHIDDKHSSLTPQQKKSIDEGITDNFPHPLSVSYHNALSAQDPATRLSIIMKDTTATMLQYLALLLLWDYANSPVSRSERVYFALEQMIYRPAHGKWLGFLREMNKHYHDVGYETRLPQLFDFLEAHGFGKSHAKVSIHHYDGTKQKVSTLESLVVLRNAWSHSKSLPNDNIEMLANKTCEIVRHLYRDLTFLKDYPLYLRSGADEFTPLRGMVISTLPQSEYHDVYIGIPDQKVPLLRLLLKRDIKKKNTEILLFEELLEDKGIRYSNSFNNVRILRKDPHAGEFVEDVLTIVEKLRPKDSLLTLNRIRFEDLRERSLNYTRQRYDEFLETGKYDPRVYLEPEGMAGKLDEFLTSDKTVYLISGKSGQGKSALVCHWVDRLLALHRDEHNDYGEHQDTNYSVFFLEIHRLNTYTESADLLNQCFRYELGLRDKSSMVEYLRKIFEKKETPKDAKFIMVADGVNEFVQTGFGIRSRSRISLLNEIISFAEMCDRTPGLEGRVKVLITLRWDIFERDGYPRDQFITDRVRFGQVPLFFPDGSEKLSDEISEIENRAALYERIRTHADGYRPNFGWDELPPGIQKMSSNPLMMRIFMHAFDGKERSELSVKNQNGFEKYFVKRLFFKQRGDDGRERERKQERGKLVLALLKEMKKGGTPHVRLDPDKVSDSVTKLIDKPRVQGEGDEGHHAYEELKENQLLREENITTMSEDSKRLVNTKRISFVHDIVARLLKEQEHIISRRFSNKLVYTLLFVYSVLMFSLYYQLHQKGFELLAYVDVTINSVITVLIIYSIYKVIDLFEKGGRYIQDYFLGKDDVLSMLERLSMGKEISKYFGSYIVAYIICLSIAYTYIGVFGDNKYIYDIKSISSMIGWGIPLVVILIWIITTTIIVNKLRDSSISARILDNNDCRVFISGMFSIVYLPIIFTIYINIIDILMIWLFNYSFFFKQTTISYSLLSNYTFIINTTVVTALATLLLIYLIITFFTKSIAARLAKPNKSWPEYPDIFVQNYFKYSNIVIVPCVILLPLIPIMFTSNTIEIDGEILNTRDNGGLVVSNNNVKEIEITNNINVNPKNITNINELTKYSSIDRLTIAHTNIYDLKPLKELPNLNFLWMWYNPQIVDYSPIGYLNKLEWLWLGVREPEDTLYVSFDLLSYDKYNYIDTDLSFINKLTNLRSLHIDMNKGDNLYFSELSFIESMHNLENLAIGNSPIVNIEPIAQLQNLTRLVIRNTFVSDLSPLEKCIKLEIVSISKSKIEDISVLGDLPNLKSINLTDVGKITGISDLLRSESLERIYIYNSEIADTVALEKLKESGVEVNWINVD